MGVCKRMYVCVKACEWMGVYVGVCTVAGCGVNVLLKM